MYVLYMPPTCGSLCSRAQAGKAAGLICMCSAAPLLQSEGLGFAR
ncbi:hypothetical protein HMPREF1986_00472, partial [Oribacterium sp. oral taxon 078 str. F0263]